MGWRSQRGASRCRGQGRNDFEPDWLWAATFRGSALFGCPASADSLKALPFQIVLDPDGGIGIAVDPDCHPVEGVGAALEYKRREITLAQGLRQSIRVVFMLHGGYLKHETRKVPGKRGRESRC